ncbi:unnamed protein product [Rangifer tarandus platyrhynchus]|uniref:Leptin receptor overlapping transcript-like 1 n=1 Tax=Rangifer tarandus platyrhynchus TaxID=3082113 RepID=A0ABN8ZCW1_RANTA|nr:unnamed protein product [Rangifer tarandus platyrhynchus]
MAGIKGGPGALSPGGLGRRPKRGDVGPTRGPHAVSRDQARAAGLPALAADSRLPATATPAYGLRAAVGAAGSRKGLGRVGGSRVSPRPVLSSAAYLPPVAPRCEELKWPRRAFGVPQPLGSTYTRFAGVCIRGRALISLSFGGAIGLMFLMLGCALPIYNQYWPLFVLFFYILSPIPYCIARRLVDDTDAMSNACKELAIFLTTGIVVSAFGLPIVFARAHLIEWGACALVLTGNTVIFATILGFFLVFGSNDDFSWQQW